MSIQLNVEPNEAQMILAGLGKIALESSIDVWFKVKMQFEQQIQAQQAAQAAPVAPAVTPAPMAPPANLPLTQADVRPVE